MFYFLLICLVAMEILPASSGLNDSMSQWREAKAMLKSQVLSHKAVRDKLCPAEKNSSVSLLFRFETYETPQTSRCERFILDGPKPRVEISFDVLLCNELEQSFTTVNFLGVSWNDSDISWNPDDYEGISLLNLDFADLWHPKIIVTNAADPELSVIHPLSGQLQLRNTGEIDLLTPVFLKTTCSFDLSMYPFDVQDCEIIFLPFIDDCNLQLTTERYSKLPDPFQLKGEWAVVNQSISTSTYVTGYNIIFPTARVSLNISRSSLFYVITVIAPMVLTSLMNTLVFLIPPESGEKVSFLVSIFVSNAVFLNFISGTIPRSMTLSNIPRLTLFLIGVMVQSFMALLATMFVMAKYKGEQNDNTDFISLKSLLGMMSTNEESDPQHQNKEEDRVHCQYNGSDHSFSLNSAKELLFFFLQKSGINIQYHINILTGQVEPNISQKRVCYMNARRWDIAFFVLFNIISIPFYVLLVCLPNQ